MKKTIALILLFVLYHSISFSQSQGEKNGPWRNTYPNGNVKSTGQFNHNIPYGEFTHYYENGNIKATTKFSNHGIDAYNKTMYESGNLMAEGKYLNKIKDSTWTYYGDSTNQRISVEHYKNGELDGESITYYPGSEQVAEIIMYKKGQKQGDLRKYFPNGQLMTSGTYHHNLLEGLFTLYYPDGTTQITGTYVNGEQADDWKYYNETGKEMTYEDFIYLQSNPIDTVDPDKDGKEHKPF